MRARILAAELGAAGQQRPGPGGRPGDRADLADYQANVERFSPPGEGAELALSGQRADAPFPDRARPAPDRATASRTTPGYFVQEGPLPFASDYLRSRAARRCTGSGPACGCSRTTSRLPSRYGVGRDWPIGYDDLPPDYEQAEREIGVAADVDDQQVPRGPRSAAGYLYPMHRVPPSYLDRRSPRRLERLTVQIGGDNYPIGVTVTRQGRNSSRTRTTPRVGASPAVGDPPRRCAARGTRAASLSARRRPSTTRSKTLLAVAAGPSGWSRQAVASKVLFDPPTAGSPGIEYLR